VSAWSARAREAGFDGWELFENHYRLAGADERAAIAGGPLPIRVFNTYAEFTETGSDERRAALATALRLGARAIKFNIGNDQSRIPHYRAAVAEAFEFLGGQARLWCECHPDTWLEEPGRIPDFCSPWRDWPFDVILHPFQSGPAGVQRWGRMLGHHLVHAHVQTRSPDDPERFARLSADPAHSDECLAALWEIGFDGSFSLEFAAPTAGPKDEPEALFAAARNDLEFLRERWPNSAAPI